MIDVQGYYQLPLAAYVGADGDPLAENVRVTSSTRRGDGEYTVQFDRDVDTCAYQVTPFEKTRTANAFATDGAADSVDVTVTATDGTPLDTPFYLGVTC